MLKASWEQGEKEKSWRGFMDLRYRYWGMGVQVRHDREGPPEKPVDHGEGVG